jgi:predicted secreted Zn-dependent protease
MFREQNGAAIFMRGARDCSIADVSVTGHGKCCSSQNRPVHGATPDVSAYMDAIESRLARDVKPV